MTFGHVQEGLQFNKTNLASNEFDDIAQKGKFTW